MFAQFRYLDGPAAGQLRTAPADFATLGRHPGSDVPFDPERDLEVSLRHAAVFKQGGGFLVRDLGSMNGTYVNGHRVRGDQPLEPNDVLQLGPTGPRLEFTVADALPRSASPPAPAWPEPPRFRRPRPTERVAVPRPRAQRTRWIVAGGVVLGLVAIGHWYGGQRRDREQREATRAMLLDRTDDLLTRLEQSRSAEPGVSAALAEARTAAMGFNRAVAAASGTRALDSLADALGPMTRRHEAVLNAAALDPRQATRPADRAVAVIVAELAGGAVVSGTGVALAARADTVWVLTARHLVRDSAGLPAIRLAVIFNGTGQAYRATLGRVHDTADVAAIWTRVRGSGPPLPELHDSATVTDAVAILGFPGGIDSLGHWRVRGTAATATVGTVIGTEAATFSVQGYGGAGPAGAAVLSTTGAVVGLVTGQRPAGAAPVVDAVPGRMLRTLLP